MEMGPYKKKGKKKKKKKKTKSASETTDQPRGDNSNPPKKTDNPQEWKNWYKSKILKGLEEGKDEAVIAHELKIQPQSIKKFLS